MVAVNAKKEKDDNHIQGTYYTPKRIVEYIEGETLTTETGAFLKKAADEIEKGLTKNPPYSIKQK